jgi:hypothetical protein
MDWAEHLRLRLKQSVCQTFKHCGVISHLQLLSSCTQVPRHLHDTYTGIQAPRHLHAIYTGITMAPIKRQHPNTVDLEMELQLPSVIR